MDNGPTPTDVRRMNRAELNDLAPQYDLKPEDYSNADDLRAALLERMDEGNDNDNDDTASKSETTVTSPDRTTTLKAVIEPVEHDKGRRVVNVVRFAEIVEE